MKSRNELIDAGKVWQLYYAKTPDDIIFEGTESACRKYLKDSGQTKPYKAGYIRLGKLIYEPA